MRTSSNFYWRICFSLLQQSANSHTSDKVYADDGISATSTKGREQFNAMIEDCKKGLIDMIFTKSISRFARNTVDCLNYIRMLKEMNIPVFFEKESINTMDSKGDAFTNS